MSLIAIAMLPAEGHRGIQLNRGFRIEMNSVLGPYKGGLRYCHSFMCELYPHIGPDTVSESPALVLIN